MIHFLYYRNVKSLKTKAVFLGSTVIDMLALREMYIAREVAGILTPAK